MQSFILYLGLMISVTASGAETCSDGNLQKLNKLSEYCRDKTYQIPGFVCQSVGQCGSTRCRGKIASYHKEVSIVIPANFQFQKPANLNLHFHGHTSSNIENDHFNLKTGWGDFGCFASQANANSIIVIPESTGKCQDYLQITADSFPKILADVKKTIEGGASGNEKITFNEKTKLSLSGHSGGYSILSRIGLWSKSNSQVQDSLKNLTGLALYDSAYGEREETFAGLSRLIQLTQDHSKSQVTVAWNRGGGNNPINSKLKEKFNLASSTGQTQFYSNGGSPQHSEYMKVYMADFLKGAFQ